MKVKFQTYKSNDGWRVRVTHKNGKILFVSSEAYRRKFDANRTLTNLLLEIQSGNYQRDSGEPERDN